MELKWGETPWDGMSREDLLREVQRMYAAVNAAHSVMNLVSLNQPDHLFWGKEGSGGRALEMTRQIDEPLRERYGDGIHNALLRYALDLLFDGSTYRIGSGWAVCPVCGDMYGRRVDGVSSVGTPCSDHLRKDCSGILRPLEWSDLETAAEDQSSDDFKLKKGMGAIEQLAAVDRFLSGQPPYCMFCGASMYDNPEFWEPGCDDDCISILAREFLAEYRRTEAEAVETEEK
jgi:hypothetical protein